MACTRSTNSHLSFYDDYRLYTTFHVFDLLFAQPMTNDGGESAAFVGRVCPVFSCHRLTRLLAGMAENVRGGHSGMTQAA
jgi:hypothetical protein